MPTYQYQCADCHAQFEQFQKFSDDPITVCPTCAGTVRRVIQNVGVVFKGSGWYINDSRKSSSEKAAEKPAGDTHAAEKPATPETDSPPKAEKPKKSTKDESAPAAAPAATP